MDQVRAYSTVTQARLTRGWLTYDQMIKQELPRASSGLRLLKVNSLKSFTRSCTAVHANNRLKTTPQKKVFFNSPNTQSSFRP